MLSVFSSYDVNAYKLMKLSIKSFFKFFHHWKVINTEINFKLLLLLLKGDNF